MITVKSKSRNKFSKIKVSRKEFLDIIDKKSDKNSISYLGQEYSHRSFFELNNWKPFKKLLSSYYNVFEYLKQNPDLEEIIIPADIYSSSYQINFPEKQFLKSSKYKNFDDVISDALEETFKNNIFNFYNTKKRIFEILNDLIQNQEHKSFYFKSSVSYFKEIVGGLIKEFLNNQRFQKISFDINYVFNPDTDFFYSEIIKKYQEYITDIITDENIKINFEETSSSSHRIEIWKDFYLNISDQDKNLEESHTLRLLNKILKESEFDMEKEIINPETGNKIKISSALTYPKDSRVYQSAKKELQKQHKKATRSSILDSGGTAALIASTGLATHHGLKNLKNKKLETGIKAVQAIFGARKLGKEIKKTRDEYKKRKDILSQFD